MGKKSDKKKNCKARLEKTSAMIRQFIEKNSKPFYFHKPGWHAKTKKGFCFQPYDGSPAIGYAPFGRWKKEKIYANAYKKIKKNFLDILPHEVSIPLVSFVLLSVLTTPLKKIKAEFSCLLSLSGGTKEDRELVALYYCDIVKRGKSWSTKKLPKRHSSGDSKEKLQKKAKKMKDCVLILSEYDTAKQISMIRDIYEQSKKSERPNGMGLLLRKTKPKDKLIYNIDISNVDLSKIRERMMGKRAKKVKLDDYLIDFACMLITDMTNPYGSVCKKLEKEQEEILNQYNDRVFPLDSRSILTFQYLLLAYRLLLEMGQAQGYIENTEELLELQEHAADIFLAGLQPNEFVHRPTKEKEPTKKKESAVKQEPQKTPIQRLFDCLDKHFAESNGTMRKIGLAKPENPDEIEMWYDDECLYIYKKTLENILKQNNGVTNLFNKVKEELNDKGFIKTLSRKKSTTEYSIKMPTRFKGDKDGKRAVCFYRAKCSDKGYFCKTLKKLESMSENA